MLLWHFQKQGVYIPDLISVAVLARRVNFLASHLKGNTGTAQLTLMLLSIVHFPEFCHQHTLAVQS